MSEINKSGIRILWDDKTIHVDTTRHSTIDEAYDKMRDIWVHDVQEQLIDVPPTFPFVKMSEHHYKLCDGWHLRVIDPTMRNDTLYLSGAFQVDEFKSAMLDKEKPGIRKNMVLLCNDAMRILDLIMDHFGKGPIRVGNTLFWIEQTVYKVIIPLKGDDDTYKFKYDAICRRSTGTRRILIATKDFNVACSMLSFAISAMEMSYDSKACIGDSDE